MTMYGVSLCGYNDRLGAAPSFEQQVDLFFKAFFPHHGNFLGIIQIFVDIGIVDMICCITVAAQ